MKQKKVLVFGYFGYETNQLDGQTVKTRSIYELLAKNQNLKVSFSDTQSFRHKPLNSLKCIKDIITSDTVIWLPAHNNLKYLLPIIWPIALLSHTKIVYSVIGGWLVPFLQKLPIHRWMLSRLHKILAETTTVKSGLEEQYGFENVSLLYNFREIEGALTPSTNENLKLVFCARINRKKGLATVFNFLDSLPVESKISVDFYGPVASEDKEWFEAQIKSHPKSRFAGVLQPSEIQKTLNQYDIMLFPTQYFTEGLPGTIIDSYFASIPVIATEWLNAHEFIKDGKTGIIISFENNQQAFNDAIHMLDKNRQQLAELKQGANSESRRYTAQFANEILMAAME